LHRGDGVLCIAHNDGRLEIRRIAVEIRTREEYLRADAIAGSDLLAQLFQKSDAAAHIAHGGDAVGNEKRKNEFAAAGGFASAHKVEVHVGESGNEKFAGSIDDLCTARDTKG